jgi:hypothetical protein
MWYHIDSLLGNDREANETTAVARQRPTRQLAGWLESGVSARSVSMAAQATMHTMSRVF